MKAPIVDGTVGVADTDADDEEVALFVVVVIEVKEDIVDVVTGTETVLALPRLVEDVVKVVLRFDLIIA